MLNCVPFCLEEQVQPTGRGGPADGADGLRGGGAAAARFVGQAWFRAGAPAGGASAVGTDGEVTSPQPGVEQGRAELGEGGGQQPAGGGLGGVEGEVDGLLLHRDLDPNGAEVVRPELERHLVPTIAPPVQRDDGRHDLFGDGWRRHWCGRRRIRRNGCLRSHHCDGQWHGSRDINTRERLLRNPALWKKVLRDHW